MAWASTWGDVPQAIPKPPAAWENDLVTKAKEDFKQAFDWEAQARLNFEYDYKFANGDTHNKFQWDNDLIVARELDNKPCLTINKVQQHNLMVINDAKQNKPGVRIRPVGDEASFEGAQIYQELIYHIEYISNAENIYDSAVTFQVEAGWGYWRVDTDYISDKTFDQEIYIRHIKDPRCVYLDPDINEIDGSDARWGIIFEDVDKKLFAKQYPKFAGVVGNSTLGNVGDGWVTQNQVRVALYYYKEEKEDKLVHWITPNEQIQVIKKESELDDNEKLLLKAIRADGKQAKELYQYKERDIVTDDIYWCKIAGDRVIEGPTRWLGKYIPIVRVIGTETVIDGVLDRKGHTRALINAQQIYNFMSSSNVEFISTQTKAPWVAPSAAIEGFEEYYKTANRVNHSYLPFNAYDDEGNQLPAPQRNSAVVGGQGYVQQLQVAQNEMMMASGQYQAQFGENENAKSGVAINARQRQGDRATYHFIDNQAIAIRFTGKIIIDLIPKVYDTPRIKKIMAQDGTRMNIKIDPDAQQELQNVGDPNNPLIDNGMKVKEYVFNPDFGMYDIQSDTGPSYATKRMETANILTQIASSDENFLKIGGDILFKNLDFAGADVLAMRYANL
ncbi:MAG TPA: portal protein, partial [Gammaproteobacteria bacterium]|nr:portal protein [Gammaproteobacteria bacterium]